MNVSGIGFLSLVGLAFDLLVAMQTLLELRILNVTSINQGVFISFFLGRIIHTVESIRLFGFFYLLSRLL